MHASRWEQMCAPLPDKEWIIDDTQIELTSDDEGFRFELTRRQ